MSTGLTVEAEKVRDRANIPDDVRLQGEADDGSGLTPVSIGGFSCGRAAVAGGADALDFRFAEMWANVEPPQWEGVDKLGTSRYLLPSFASDRDIARSWRHGLGVGHDALAYDPGVSSRLDPMVGATGSYSFSSPEFVLEGIVTDTAPTDVPFFLHAWRQGARGMGNAHFWVSPLGVGSATVSVTARAGSLLASLACEGADECTINTGALVVTFDKAPYRMSTTRDWWNPRQDVG